jgi:hypothetical protein
MFDRAVKWMNIWNDTSTTVETPEEEANSHVMVTRRADDVTYDLEIADSAHAYITLGVQENGFHQCLFAKTILKSKW